MAPMKSNWVVMPLPAPVGACNKIEFVIVKILGCKVILLKETSQTAMAWDEITLFSKDLFYRAVSPCVCFGSYHCFKTQGGNFRPGVSSYGYCFVINARLTAAIKLCCYKTCSPYRTRLLGLGWHCTSTRRLGTLNDKWCLTIIFQFVGIRYLLAFGNSSKIMFNSFK